MTFGELEDGRWYAIGFLAIDECMDYGPIYLWTGAEFCDEGGETVTSLYCPSLGCRVAVDAADDYALQR